MLVEMSRQDFDLLDDDALGWKCVEPTLLQIRGKDMTVKTEALAELGTGQQSLFMFRVFYDHARNSMTEFYCWTAQLLDQPNYWSGVMKGLSFFGDSSMIKILEETRTVLEARSKELGQRLSDFNYIDLENNKELRMTISQLFQKFQDVVPDSLKRISSYIRSNPQQFIEIKD